jgi:hypothetical protein
MSPFDSLKSAARSLESQQGPEPEELKKGKEDLKKILTKLAEKEKEIESSNDTAERKSERYAKIAEVLKTQVTPVLQSWLTKYPERKEGITKALTQIEALVKKYEKKSEELAKSTEKRQEASAETAQPITTSPENQLPPETAKENTRKQAVNHVNILLGTSLTDIKVGDMVLVDGQQMRVGYVDIDPGKNEYYVTIGSSLADISIREYGSRIEVNHCYYKITSREEVKEFLTGQHNIVRNKIEETENIKRQAIARINRLSNANLKDLKIGDKILINGAEMECNFIEIDNSHNNYKGYSVYYTSHARDAELALSAIGDTDVSDITINGEKHRLTAKNTQELLLKLSDNIKAETEKNQEQEQAKQALKDQIVEQLAIAEKNETSWQEAERILLNLKETVQKTDTLIEIPDPSMEGHYSRYASTVIENKLRDLYHDYVVMKINELDLDLNNTAERRSGRYGEGNVRSQMAWGIVKLCESRGVSSMDINLSEIFEEGEDLEFTPLTSDNSWLTNTERENNRAVLKRIADKIDEKKSLDLKQKHIEDQIELATQNKTSWQEAERILLKLRNYIESNNLSDQLIFSDLEKNRAKETVELELSHLYVEYLLMKMEKLDLDLMGIGEYEHRSRVELAQGIVELCQSADMSPMEIKLDEIFKEGEDLDEKNKEVLKRVEEYIKQIKK